VQDFPGDFDGVVAGAPAFAFNNLTSWSGSFYTITGPANSPNFIPPKLWPTITKDTMNQCDSLDGHVDGILENPNLCNYDPKGLLCKEGGNSSACLTAAQIITLRRFYQPLVQTDGSIIYPRLNPGSGSPAVASGSPFPFTVDWFRYAIYQDPTWDATKLNLEDMAHASRLNPSNAETWNGDLSAFKARGSKVIHYHGHEDSLISSTNSARYYEHVRSTMKSTTAQLDEFYRYFQISGTGHCGGGSGASQIGQSATSAASLDPDSNVLFAIIRWVEEGVAPDTIKGTKFVNSRTKEIQFQRKHCRYPKQNKYAGTGDATKASSWNCVD
jgi:feruloyl esterase